MDARRRESNPTRSSWRGQHGRGRGGAPGPSPRSAGRSPQAEATHPASTLPATAPPVARAGPPRRMEHVASISRSSGLQADGDTLKDLQVQETYWKFVLGKLDEYWRRYEVAPLTREQMLQRKDARENVLILFRKLREGIIACHRTDAFAVEVYETSLHLAVLFTSPVQTTSTLSHLLPALYLPAGAHAKPALTPAPAASGSAPSRSNATATVLLSALHHLVAAYPSQSTCRAHLRTLPPALHPRASAPHAWVRELCASLRTRNYVRAARLTERSVYAPFLRAGARGAPEGPAASVAQTAVGKSAAETEAETGTGTGAGADAAEAGGCPRERLAALALDALVGRLRDRARESAWRVIRGAYREFACEADSPTRAWLATALTLGPGGLTESESEYGAADVGADGEAGGGRLGVDSALDGWMEEREGKGEVTRKEGVEGRWIVSKKG